MADRQTHWEGVYGTKEITEVSWYQDEPRLSMQLIAAALDGTGGAVIDVGGGASALATQLWQAGHQDVTVLDLSGNALATARRGLGPDASAVHWVVADVLDWEPARTYRVWHDRAVFHFLTEEADRERYRATLRRSLGPGGYAVVGTFADDGPTHCSGLPTARYTPAGLAAQFPWLRVCQAHREEHRTPGGTVQPFTWLLLAG